jgi:hypothetical protein
MAWSGIGSSGVIICFVMLLIVFGLDARLLSDSVDASSDLGQVF